MSKLLLPVLATAALAAAGCANRHQTNVVPLSDARVDYDEAMEVRDWPQTLAGYGDEAVTAGPTYYEYEYVGFGRDGQARKLSQPAASRLGDTFVFLGNTLLLPVRLVQTPPWKSVAYQPDLIPPTYHAAPPLLSAERVSGDRVEGLPPVRDVSPADGELAPAEADGTPVDGELVPTERDGTPADGDLAPTPAETTGAGGAGVAPR